MKRREDHYKTLGVPRDADPGEIKRAYRERAKRTHPDRRGGDDARFSDLNEAYHTLCDSARRQQHDDDLHRDEQTATPPHWTPQRSYEPPFAGYGWGNIFSLFSGIIGSGRWWKSDTGAASDVQMELQLNEIEAASGVRVPIELTEHDLDPERRLFAWDNAPFRTVVVASIPAGVEDGQLFRYRFHDGEGISRTMSLRITIERG